MRYTSKAPCPTCKARPGEACKVVGTLKLSPRLHARRLQAEMFQRISKKGKHR